MTSHATALLHLPDTGCFWTASTHKTSGYGISVLSYTTGWHSNTVTAAKTLVNEQAKSQKKKLPVGQESNGIL